MVGSSVNARVAVEPQLGVYYKEFLPRGPMESLKAAFRGSRASRARQCNDELREAGFDAPVNLAWGKLPGGREYLFSSAMQGQGVTWWLQSQLTGREGEQLQRRRELLRSLGSFVGRMHASGFIHGDLRTSNVLAHYRDAQFHFALIDNERNAHKNPAPGRAVMRNLMQLNMLPPPDLSNRDRMRFFCQWRREMADLSAAEAKLLAVKSYEWAMRRLRAKGKVT